MPRRNQKCFKEHPAAFNFEDDVLVDSDRFDRCEANAIKRIKKGQLSRALDEMVKAFEPSIPKPSDFFDRLKDLHPPCSSGLDLNGDPDISVPQPDPSRDHVSLSVNRIELCKNCFASKNI